MTNTDVRNTKGPSFLVMPASTSRNSAASSKIYANWAMIVSCSKTAMARMILEK